MSARRPSSSDAAPSNAVRDPAGGADHRELARALIDALRARGLHVATAESCTGGGIAAAITDIAGSSDVFECGFVTYSNAAKSRMLGVDGALIAACGAVSEDIARAMADGARVQSGARCAVAVTGVAGPGGGTPAKPVGMVCFGYALPDHPATSETCHFSGDRAAVRSAAVGHALDAMLRQLDRL
ncbi:MAG TPA: nicotinamide-nucleotide amidohydrolase family protein [Casimicrobiaceae bacterium]|nr:nicotinamide-nucleotide amidohydrolase family protein [Casimicrobiaceae bacterium]